MTKIDEKMVCCYVFVVSFSFWKIAVVTKVFRGLSKYLGGLPSSKWLLNTPSKLAKGAIGTLASI